MTEAKRTPSIVQKQYLHSTVVNGSPVRIVEYLCKVGKTDQNDWIEMEDAGIEGTFIGARAYTIDSSNDGVEDETTFTDTDKKITLTSATVGTSYVRVLTKN